MILEAFDENMQGSKEGLACQLNSLVNSGLPQGSEVTHIRDDILSHLPKEIWEPARETFGIMSTHWLCGVRGQVSVGRERVVFFWRVDILRMDESPYAVGARVTILVLSFMSHRVTLECVAGTHT